MERLSGPTSPQRTAGGADDARRLLSGGCGPALGAAGALLVGLCVYASDASTHSALEVGSVVADFRVAALDETPFSLAESLRTNRAVVVVFLSTVCPYSRFFARHLRELHERFGEEGAPASPTRATSPAACWPT